MDHTTEIDNQDEHVLQLYSEVVKGLKGGKFPCASAEKLARERNICLLEIGHICNRLSISIGWCQLGLFGCGSKGKVLKKKNHPFPGLEEAIRDHLVSGRITCRSVWDIATKFGLPRINVASACEALNVKICSCQLGAF